MPERPLPLFPRVVFVDWHGVVSRDPFWASIRSSARHPLRHHLEQVVSDVLRDEARSAGWMLGEVSTQDIVGEVQVQAPRRYREDFLVRRMLDDCARMSVDIGVVTALAHMRALATVVLATDNMDGFATTFRRYALPSRRVRTLDATLATQARLFDDLLCSSEVGALKAADPMKFFGPWLNAAGMDFRDALLIDDRSDNCGAFRACGGRALQWRIGDPLDALADEVTAWAMYGFAAAV